MPSFILVRESYGLVAGFSAMLAALAIESAQCGAARGWVVARQSSGQTDAERAYTERGPFQPLLPSKDFFISQNYRDELRYVPYFHPKLARLRQRCHSRRAHW